MRRFHLPRRHFLALIPTTAIAACGSPPVQNYRLAAVPGPPVPGVNGQIGVRGISIPADLDANEIPSPSSAYQVTRFANDVWAAPLGGMLQTVMVQNLTQRLPEATVIATGGAVGAPVTSTIEINVLEFDPSAAGPVTLLAQIAIRSGETPRYISRNISLSSPPPTPDAAGIAAAMSTLWGAAADQIAGLLTHTI